MSRKILIGLAAGAFALAGCKKADTPAPATAPDAATAAVPASTHSFAPAIDAGDFNDETGVWQGALPTCRARLSRTAS